MNAFIWFLIWVGTLSTILYHRTPLLISTPIAFTALLVITLFSPWSWFSLALWWTISLSLAIVLNLPQLRHRYLSAPAFKLFQKALPKMSDTERTAIGSGTVGWDGELFSGTPDWNKLLQYPKPVLNEEEQAFLNGPVEELLAMTNDWEITHRDLDLPPKVWTFLKEEGFFAFIIPKVYGGKAFSAYAHSEILTKLASKSLTLASIVAVPNSLGPAELILHYGTDQQKEYYLPRLAKGKEIPCFALTGPEAGSDASSIPDLGIVCEGNFEGKTILGIRLQWDKRYITLAPVATVLGLAFKLYDPDQKLGTQLELGITCALIPTQTPGIAIGKRHFPLNIPFQNGPTQGKDVFIPLEWIIGGQAMIGQGWRMLVECLTTGRAISLPSNTAGSSKVAALSSGAYAKVREQFHAPLSAFEGIQEALGSIGGLTYVSDSARRFTAALVDHGEKPAVPGAISKCHVTEMARKISILAMDVHGGKGIMLGPNNYLARGYQGAPIAITVEGANILTRCMIIFGQGAMRCHPYILKEIEAVQDNRPDTFGNLLLQHIGFTLSNACASFFHALTYAKCVRISIATNCPRAYQQLDHASRAFAFIADMTMLLVGGKLKFKECISARLGDLLSMMYLGSTALKRYHDDQEPTLDAPFIVWATRYTLGTFWQTMDQLLDNYPNRWLGKLLRIVIMPFGIPVALPSDQQSKAVSELLTTPNEARRRLVEGIYLSDHPNNLLAQLEKTLAACLQTQDLRKRLAEASKSGQLSTHFTIEGLIEEAVQLKLLDEPEAAALRRYEILRKQLIAVDAFDPKEL